MTQPRACGVGLEEVRYGQLGWGPRTGTEYMVLMLLLNRSVASMNKLSMGVFCERRSFTCRERWSGLLTFSQCRL